MATNPLIQQGTLNRVRCSVVVPNYSGLNITSSYMGQAFATISFAEPFSELIPTATGAVTSPEPYVIATIGVDLLRTQALALSWLAQAGTQSDLGPVTIHSDTAAFPEITIDNAVIQSIEPGAYDGKNPVVRLSIKGVYYINNNLWSLT